MYRVRLLFFPLIFGSLLDQTSILLYTFGVVFLVLFLLLFHFHSHGWPWLLYDHDDDGHGNIPRWHYTPTYRIVYIFVAYFWHGDTLLLWSYLVLCRFAIIPGLNLWWRPFTLPKPFIHLFFNSSRPAYIYM